jgi:hypothetical protein
MTVINEQPASRKPRIAQQNGVVAVGDGALEPVIQSALIQSALGIVRERAGLLSHRWLWRRVGIGPEDIPTKTRHQADTLGRAKRECNPFSSTRNFKPPAKTQQE